MKRNKHLLLWSSLASLALLVGAAAEENVFKEWRVLQSMAAPETTPVEVRLRQVVVPALGVADRCVTCHVGMAPGEPTAIGHPALKPHPPVVHDPAQFGCTVCHGGQGRATAKDDAHGVAPFWPEPMLPLPLSQAGCGTCHTHLKVPSLPELRGGLAAYERLDCLACHRLDGRGGTLRPDGGGMEGPDLSLVGARGYREDWYDQHLAARSAATSGPWTTFAAIAPADRDALDTVLESRVGAPKLVEAKALFHSRGCRGCHALSGVGGVDGPALTTTGLRDPALLNFSHVPGPRTVPNWFAEHFRAPAATVPGSLMPTLGLSEPDIEMLTLYVMSLRRRELPEAFSTMDRIRAERFGEREFRVDGAALWNTFCVACHGPNGEGMRYAGMPPFPAVGNPDFLAIAPDALIRATVERGRPGRRMPSWTAAGLRPTEIDAVVAHVRTLGGGITPRPDPKPPRWVRGDVRAGESLFQANCSGCHGPTGAGGEGPALVNAVLLGAATDTYLVETIRTGRRGTAMEGFATPSPTRPALSDAEIESIVAFLRSKLEGS